MNKAVKLAVVVVQQQAARQLARLAVASNKLFVSAANNECSIKPKQNSFSNVTNLRGASCRQICSRFYFQKALKINWQQRSMGYYSVLSHTEVRHLKVPKEILLGTGTTDMGIIAIVICNLCSCRKTICISV